MNMETEDEYLQFVKLFSEKKFCFKSHNITEDKPVKLVISEFLLNIQAEIIKSDLESLGFHPDSVNDWPQG